jgi:hypothetical protein
MFFAGISHLTDIGTFEAPQLFIEAKPLINDQGDSAEAEPMDARSFETKWLKRKVASAPETNNNQRTF